MSKSNYKINSVIKINSTTTCYIFETCRKKNCKKCLKKNNSFSCSNMTKLVTRCVQHLYHATSQFHNFTISQWSNWWNCVMVNCWFTVENQQWNLLFLTLTWKWSVFNQFHSEHHCEYKPAIMKCHNSLGMTTDSSALAVWMSCFYFKMESAKASCQIQLSKNIYEKLINLK